MLAQRTKPRLLAGTGNPHKLGEIASILSRLLAVELVGTDILPGQGEVAEEGSTFEENALSKLRAYAAAAALLAEAARPRWVIADDSGLCVEALGGAPGVISARYAGLPRSDGANNRKLLEALRSTPPERRGAKFVCVVAGAEILPGPRAGSPGSVGEPFTARGECPGVIVTERRGSGGFGYDPLFLLPETGKTFAELDEAEKNRLSHRGRALGLLAERLRSTFSLEPNPAILE